MNKNLQDYKREYDALDTKCNLSGKEALEAVKQNGYALQFVREQTPEICLGAVRQNGYALQYVREQTYEICLEAVRQDGGVLRFVNSNMFTEDEIIELNGKRYKLVEEK
ncbi:MAG: DUF4116 domain-containing protein [Blastocatellia bacterium]|nr:DUF4116 domain-containing protein [Blastocatellia bacterium]